MCSYLLGGPVALANVLAIIEPGEDLLDGGLLFPSLLLLQTLAALTGLLLLVLERLLDELNVLQPELLADDIQVADRVNVTLDVDNLGIIEAPHDLEDGIDGADVRQESIAQTSTGGGATGQASNVEDSKVGGNPGLGLVLLAEPVEARIGDDDASLFGIYRGIGKVLKFVLLEGCAIL